MYANFGAKKLDLIHSDIRGPLFYEAVEMEKQGKKVLKLNTGILQASGLQCRKAYTMH